MYFGGAESQFGRICLPGLERPRKYVLKVCVVIDELQQRFGVRAVLADPKQIFCRGIQ